MGIGAYEIPGLRFSLPAGGDVSRFRFVAVDSDGAGIAADSDAVIVGASMNQAAEGEVLEVADGIVIVEAGGAIDAGATVVAGTDGVAESGDSTFVALTAAAAAGEFVSVKL